MSAKVIFPPSTQVYCGEIRMQRSLEVCLMNRCGLAPCPAFMDSPLEAKEAAYAKLVKNGHGPALLPFWKTSDAAAAVG
ncbi:MAG TPA: hypothetical protein VGK71_05095 [Nitrospirota bacterium]